MLQKLVVWWVFLCYLIFVAQQNQLSTRATLYRSELRSEAATHVPTDYKLVHGDINQIEALIKDSAYVYPILRVS